MCDGGINVWCWRATVSWEANYIGQRSESNSEYKKCHPIFTLGPQRVLLSKHDQASNNQVSVSLNIPH